MKVLAIILTGPGLAFHLTLHWTTCRILKLAMFKPPSLKSAEIIHEPAARLPILVLEGLLPSLVQLLMGTALMIAAYLSWHMHVPVALVPVLLWFGVALFIQGFPSAQDSRAVWRRLKPYAAIWLLFPFLLPPVLIGLGRKWGLHYVAGVAVAVLLGFLN